MNAPSIYRFRSSRDGGAKRRQKTTGEHARSALLGAPVTFSVGRHAPDQARDMAAGLAGWATSEFPVQASEQLAGWPPGTPSAGDQPSSGV
jgi:hypothetical protein